MTCLRKVERTLDILEISQIKKPGLVLATDEEVPDLKIGVAKSIFVLWQTTNRIKYMLLEKVMRRYVRMDAFFLYLHQPPLNDPIRKL